MADQKPPAKGSDLEFKSGVGQADSWDDTLTATLERLAAEHKAATAKDGVKHG